MVKKIVTYILLVLFISSTFYACRDKTNETSETISTTQIRFVNLSPIPFDFFVKTNDTILFDTPLSYGEMSDFLPISTGNINFVFCEEQDICLDAGVRREHAIGQTHDGVQVALGEQGFLDAGLDAFAEEGAVGQHESGAATGLEDLH